MIGNQFKTLIINFGSSSLKYRIYDNEEIVDKKIIEVPENVTEKIFKEILNSFHNSIKKLEFRKVVYRFVYGENLKSPSFLTKSLLKKLESFEDLNPLHGKREVETIKFLSKRIRAKHIICFDSAFHKTMPPKAKKYSLSDKIFKNYGIERYGFHGIAHESLIKDAQIFTGKKYKRVISCQLGSGVSLCAVKNGKSIDTTMGFTPLEGIMMETRSGNIDPSIIFYLNKKGIKMEKIKRMLERESGLKGVSGLKNMKEIIKTKSKNPKAKLAFEMFVYQVRKAIGAYIAVLGGVDLIVLGGGMSEPGEVRKGILEDLEVFNISINKRKINQKSPVKISSGKVEVVVLKTDEQKMMFETSKSM